jgi:mRNA interferase RelE/StbE
MNWEITFLPEVERDLQKIDNFVIPQIAKGIRKVATNPLPKSEGGYGTPLGNSCGSELTGLYKIKFRNIGLRVVYGLIRTQSRMVIVVIAAREDSKVYLEADKRRKVHGV